MDESGGAMDSPVAGRVSSPDAVLRGYFHAKDENRPHLLDGVFRDDAVLEVRNDTTAIAFPAVTTGREAIADVLVRSFGRTYENVYSFYLQRPHGPLDAFECDWIVVMTDKASRGVRVGRGAYLWEFDAASSGLARRLVISIAAMRIYPAETAGEAWAFVAELDYPWASWTQVQAATARHPLFAPVLRRG